MDGPMTVLDRIGSSGVVAVVVIDEVDAASGLAAALVRGGLTCVEITFRTEAAAATIEHLSAQPELLVGAGTVLGPQDVERAVDSGARFVVSPGFDRDVVRRCRELDVTVVPGIATATEATAALRAGLDAVKLFPAAALGGLRLVRALAGPFPGLRFLPTGGIVADDVPAYLGDPAVLAVGGSWVAPRKLLRERRFDEIAACAAEAAQLVAVAQAGATA
jgi:2-dehydro-3-deoxyphosphogluconate aldolase/(4S)-4-hydroxy-2-oxoglutarate aldolase